jgi:ribose transport system substrate-binding protein
MSRARLRSLAVVAAVGTTLTALAACGSASVGGGTASSAAAPAASSAAPAPSAAASSAAAAADPLVAEAKKFVEESLAAKAGFTPPATGPKAQKAGSTIVFVAADLTNGGINAVSKGVQEAAAKIGWKVTVLDGKASAQGRTDALNQALATKPAGIVLGGFDAKEQASVIKQATGLKIPVVGWHASAAPGADAATGLFTNVTTDPLEVSRMAADFAIADSGGTAGVAIFTDGQYEIAVKKADAIKAEIEKCKGCSVLTYEDSPIAEADSRMPALISSLLQKNGDKLTYLLAINGNYFGGARAALKDAGKPAEGPPKSVAAGDGDAAEFQRVRGGDYQAATVAEPLFLQGWQLVDELNRAFAGEKESGFLAKPGLVTKANAPTGDVFDPASGYRDVYAKIWSGS